MNGQRRPAAGKLLGGAKAKQQDAHRFAEEGLESFAERCLGRFEYETILLEHQFDLNLCAREVFH